MTVEPFGSETCPSPRARVEAVGRFIVRGVNIALLALHGLEDELSRTALQAKFRGIVQLRARLVKDDTTHCVLYPIFLERL